MSTTGLSDDVLPVSQDQTTPQTGQNRVVANPAQPDGEMSAQGQSAGSVQSDSVVPQPVSAVSAEEKEMVGSMFKEGAPTVYEKKEFEVSPEVKNWVKYEKKEEIVLPQPIKDEFGQILMESAQPAPLKIVLPLNKNQMGMALKYKMVDSVRWLAEWCLRLIKMFPKRVSYGSTS